MTTLGDTIVLHSPVFATAAGVETNPTSLALTVTRPDATTTVLAIGGLTNDGAGRYSYAYVTSQDGVHTYRYVGSGASVLVQDVTRHFIVGAAPSDGPCEAWIDAADVFDCQGASAIAEADRDYVLAGKVAVAASRMLYIRSGRKYPGICEDVVRPCRRSTRWASPGWWSWSDSWGSCSCGAEYPKLCGCPKGDELYLGGSPILGISEVLIDGDVLASSSYEIRDRSVLARIDGEAWPCCQDLTEPTTADDTFQVTYFYGWPVPEDGILAATRLAGEMYLACAGSNKCQLPRRVREISRQGITVGFVDPLEFFAAGNLGLYEVDSFLEGERYAATHRGTVLSSPEFGPQVRRTP